MGTPKTTPHQHTNISSKLPPLSAAERSRYARHIILPQVGVEGQRKLKAASVVVVGTGGLGSPIAMYLAAAGVGRLGLVDYDIVDATNLQRQIVHGESTVGMPKVASAAARLREINPHIHIETHAEPLTSHNALEILARYDVLVDGTDNFPTRYLLNDAAVMLGRPLVYGSIFRFEGQVSVFDATRGPCYRCLLPTPPPPRLVPSCAEAGVFGVLPGTIGTLQATEVLKLLLGIGEPLIGQLLLYDALSAEFERVIIPKRPDCPICGEHPTITELIDYEEFCGAPAYTREDDPFAGRSRPQYDPAADLTVEQVKACLDAGEPLLLLDVREPAEQDIASIKGAQNLPESQLLAHMERVPKDRPVVLFCRKGIRSAWLVAQLRAAGWQNVYNMAGGIDAWAQKIDPSIPRY